MKLWVDNELVMVPDSQLYYFKRESKVISTTSYRTYAIVQMCAAQSQVNDYPSEYPPKEIMTQINGQFTWLEGKEI